MTDRQHESHLASMRNNAETAEHKLRISLDHMGTTMRDYDMAPEARSMFRVVRHDLEYGLEAVRNIKLIIEREVEMLAEAKAASQVPE